jgi:hypothetical protein
VIPGCTEPASSRSPWGGCRRCSFRPWSGQATRSVVRGDKADRRASRELIAAYHQSQLRTLLEHVRAGFAQLDSGEIHEFDMDDLIHHYKRSAAELWKFCGTHRGDPHQDHRQPALHRPRPQRRTHPSRLATTPTLRRAPGQHHRRTDPPRIDHPTLRPPGCPAWTAADPLPRPAPHPRLTARRRRNTDQGRLRTTRPLPPRPPSNTCSLAWVPPRPATWPPFSQPPAGRSSTDQPARHPRSRTQALRPGRRWR